MKVGLEKYAGKRICVAVSGGKDSMALLHYLVLHGKEHGIFVCALNCDHAMRGEASERDSAFVKAYCASNGIVLHSFIAEKGAFADENGARKWRLECYKKVLEEGGADCIATAHHMNDNAETVLFNLARGASVSGVCGIGDEPSLGIIRPLIGCTREQIDKYIEQNKIPFVTDESNSSCDYTRNKIRLKVLPELEEAVHGAVGAIYRFSRLAREDEEYFARQIEGVTVRRGEGNYFVKYCPERAVFKRAAAKIVADHFNKKDYTAEQLERLFSMQCAESGKRFEFLGLVAVKEEGGIAIAAESSFFSSGDVIAFCDFLSGKLPVEFADGKVVVTRGESASSACAEHCKILRFDLDAISENAVVRTRRTGDRLTKFGGGSISLSDYLTDKKVPQSLRGELPLVCDGNEVLIVGGVEISDKVKVTEVTVNPAEFICLSPFKLG